MTESRFGREAPRWVKVVLWVVAVVLMLSAAVFQRLTGPTNPMRGGFELVGQEHRYRLIRSGWSYEDALVEIPDPGQGAVAALHYKRLNTDDPWTAIPMISEAGELSAPLPMQPAAGKLEYYMVVRAGGAQVRIPEDPAETVIIRFKDAVSLAILLPHVFFMFFAVLWGIRSGLGAAVAPAGMERQAWTTLALMTVGGMVLGPMVQKAAFGAYWTGWPFGYDLTDNKTLLMWIVWVVACVVLWRGERVKEGVKRGIVVVATLVMMAVYLVPHSMRGSELDYSQLDAGTPASEAVTQGN